jgi:hypothetical protein
MTISGFSFHCLFSLSFHVMLIPFGLFLITGVVYPARKKKEKVVASSTRYYRRPSSICNWALP